VAPEGLVTDVVVEFDVVLVLVVGVAIPCRLSV